MSLLLKALQQADRGSHLSLEPMEERAAEAAPAPPASAKAAAALMFEKQANAEKRRMLVLLGALVTVVLGMGVYFYLAVFMPWVFLPKPPAVAATPAPAVQAPAPAVIPPFAPVAAPQLAAASPVRAIPEAESSAPRARTKETAPPAPVARPFASAPSQDSSIKISGGSSTPSAAASSVMRAYGLLQEGRLEEARRAYENLRAQEPHNADVLLGLALIAQRQGRTDEAAQLYLKTLDVEPRNAFAQASLSGMIARADPAAAEGKLRALIAQQPAAFLHFGLGNVYAAQGRWNEAQTAYFEAQRLDPESPDYAFNLAVSLERINQPRAALDYYQRALKLSQGKAAVFDAGQVRARIQQLSVVK